MIYAGSDAGQAGSQFMADQFNRRASVADAVNNWLSSRQQNQARADRLGLIQQQQQIDAVNTVADRRRQALQDALTAKWHDELTAVQNRRYDVEDKHWTDQNSLQRDMFDWQKGQAGNDPQSTPAGRDRHRNEVAHLEDSIANGYPIDPSLYPTISQDEWAYYKNGPISEQRKQAGEQGKLATAGNAMDKIQSIISRPALPVANQGTKWNPLNWFGGGVNPADQIQPSDAALARRNQLHSAISSALQTGQITQDPISGGFKPAMRPSMPTVAPQAPQMFDGIQLSPDRSGALAGNMTLDRAPGDWMTREQRGQKNIVDADNKKRWDEWYGATDDLESLRAKQSGIDIGSRRSAVDVAGTQPAPKARGPMTPEIAGQYLQKFGSRAKAEAAAKADGYQW